MLYTALKRTACQPRLNGRHTFLIDPPLYYTVNSYNHRVQDKSSSITIGSSEKFKCDEQ